MLKVLVTIDIARLKIMQQNEAPFLHMYAKSCVTQSRIQPRRLIRGMGTPSAHT